MITETHPVKNEIDTLKYTGYAPSDCLFFDIETTGFAVRTTHVYLIGCIFHSGQQWMCTQWFAQTHEEEKEVIAAFFHFMQNYKVLIHFNGEGFDIPYLRQKAELLHITPHFEHLISIDLFRVVSSCKKFLKLENYKQKSIEKFLGVEREDQYNGGELINVYTEYQKTQDSEAYHLLLLHNSDDISGLTCLLPILTYTCLLNGAFTLDSITQMPEEIIFNCRLACEVPKRVSLGYKDFYITAYGTNLKLRVKIYSSELKYFYSNYHDYYYLPAEDMAMHKSVAFYVDKDFRTKAKAANCYSRKTGTFIPQLSEIVPTYFKVDYYDKTMYIELTEDLLNDTDLLYRYLFDIIKTV